MTVNLDLLDWRLVVALDDDGIVIGADDRPGLGEETAPEDLARAFRGMLRGGAPPAFRLPRLSAFQERVLWATIRIPFADVRTYGEVAAAAGYPRAARAVGSVMAMNPLSFIVPCHRVVRADGTIGDYGASGPEPKRALLRLEGTYEEGDRWRRTTTF